MEEELILLNISNKIIIKYFFFKSGKFYYMNSDAKESYKIAPHYFNLKLFMDIFFHPLKSILYNLNKNICFLEINIYDDIKISCEWCSICNGVIHTVKENIIKKPSLIKKINLNKLKKMEKYLDFILIDRKIKLKKKEIIKWSKKTFNKISIDYLLISSIYLKLELIELRWCPFKRSKKFYYRNFATTN